MNHIMYEQFRLDLNKKKKIYEIIMINSRQLLHNGNPRSFFFSSHQAMLLIEAKWEVQLSFFSSTIQSGPWSTIHSWSSRSTFCVLFFFYFFSTPLGNVWSEPPHHVSKGSIEKDTILKNDLLSLTNNWKIFDNLQFYKLCKHNIHNIIEDLTNTLNCLLLTLSY